KCIREDQGNQHHHNQNSELDQKGDKYGPGFAGFPDPIDEALFKHVFPLLCSRRAHKPPPEYRGYLAAFIESRGDAFVSAILSISPLRGGGVRLSLKFFQ